MCLPLAVSEPLDSESLNIFDESDEKDESDERDETVESINAFLDPFQDSLDDEIGQTKEKNIPDWSNQRKKYTSS
jgi:hypothetical protein